MSMTTTKSNSTGVKKDSKLVESLNLMVADTYALLGLTQLAHWNVEGSGFFALHKAFEEQYEGLFKAADEIAERVRGLDAFAIGGLAKMAKTAGLEEFTSPMAQKDYVAALIVAHEKVIGDAKATRDLAGDSNDLETQDLMVKRIQWHDKTVWMLKSYLK